MFYNILQVFFHFFVIFIFYKMHHNTTNHIAKSVCAGTLSFEIFMILFEFLFFFIKNIKQF